MKQFGHIAPKHGYDTWMKGLYRETIWDLLSTFILRAGLLIADQNVFCLPAGGQHEIPVILKHGYSKNNVWMCDFSAAKMASASKFLGINGHSYGSEVSIAVNRHIRKNRARFTAVNLDFMGTVKTAPYMALPILSKHALTDLAWLAITYQRGRDCFLGDVTDRDRARLDFIQKVFDTTDSKCSFLINGQYASMGWAMYEITRKRT